jgi:hypothetical protein
MTLAKKLVLHFRKKPYVKKFIETTKMREKKFIIISELLKNCEKFPKKLGNREASSLDQKCASSFRE